MADSEMFHGCALVAFASCTPIVERHLSTTFSLFLGRGLWGKMRNGGVTVQHQSSEQQHRRLTPGAALASTKGGSRSSTFSFAIPTILPSRCQPRQAGPSAAAQQAGTNPSQIFPLQTWPTLIQATKNLPAFSLSLPPFFPYCLFSSGETEEGNKEKRHLDFLLPLIHDKQPEPNHW